ncbi:MAG TPA: hypothetical protein VKL21_04110 [Candidatus Methanoperedens sp.]|nr:hypothetical protein [Candidatus Methanoperedens sp.]
MKIDGVHDKELTLWFLTKGCTLDEANCFADETIREIEFYKEYEAYQDERLGNSRFGQKVEVSKRFIRATNEGAAIIS